MSTVADPRELLDNSAMNSFQIMAVVICILLNALDGFDVLAISFASPGIADEWAINRAGLGIVLAMELVGMAIGSIALGGIADRIGRRPTILCCLVIMAVGMYLAALSQSVTQLLVVRFVTGLGIGGMLASINAMVAEYSNAKHRNLAVILMATGYPLGATVGGSVASLLLEHADWRAVFEFGAICTAAFIVIVWFWLPESIQYLCTQRGPDSLERINNTLSRMGHEEIQELPPLPAAEEKLNYSALFSDRFRALTVLLCIGYSFHIMTFYYILKWIPKIVVDMGYEPSTAGSVLVWANLGGACGALFLGLASSRFGLRRLLMVLLVLGFVMVSCFALGQSSIKSLSVISAVIGFFTNAGVVGFYALIASTFPADVRAGGTGFVIGIGRGGAVLGPVLAGFLFASGAGLLATSVVMGLGALLAAVAVFFLRRVLESHRIAAKI